MGAGATYCCSQDERKSSLKAYINNLQLTGVDGIGDVGSSEIAAKYKNLFESQVKLSRDGVLHLHDDLMQKFSSQQLTTTAASVLSNDMMGTDPEKVTVKVLQSDAGLSDKVPTVLQQFRFANQGRNFEILQKSILDGKMCKMWDKKIVQTNVAGQVQSSNILLLRQTVTNNDIAGPGTRELLLKRFFFRFRNRLYVYTSSIPEQVLEQHSEEEINEDVDRLTVIFQIQCFWRTKTDVFMN